MVRASNAVSGRTYLRRLGSEAFGTARRRAVKLILPLASLVGALTLLLNSWGAMSLGYL